VFSLKNFGGEIMKAKDFVSIIFSSIWARVGLFMDLLGIVIYVKPELTGKLSFSNLIHQYLWLWIAIGSIILVSSIAWEATKKIREIRESSKLPLFQKVNIEQKYNDLAIGIMNGNIIQPDGKKKRKSE